MKFAIFALSDPGSGDEALGRVFNALAFAAEAHGNGDDVELVFQGAGTRWPAELDQLGHPAHALYEAVRPIVMGASAACAAVFGAADSVKKAGLRELKDNALPGTPGLGSMRRYLAEGRQTFVF